MSTDKAPAPSVFQRLRPAAALNYLVLTAGGLAVYAMIMLGKGNDVGAIVALLIALAGVLARWSASPALILLLTIYLMIDPGFFCLLSRLAGDRWSLPRSDSGFSLEDMLLAAALLAYAVGHFRLTAIIHQSMPDDPTVRRDRDLTNPPRRPADLVPATELPRTLVVAAGCVVAGQVAWLIVIMFERLGRPNDSDLTIGMSRFLLVAWITGISLMLVSAALVYIRSTRMTRLEASLLLRDEFFQENRRETDRLQRWRRWYKERVARRRRAGK